MPIDFTFRSAESKSLDELIKFIAPQDLGYPHFNDWTEKVRGEIRLGVKQGYIMYSYGCR